MNNSDKSKFEAGKGVGQTQEKGNQAMGKVGGAAQTAKESVVEAGKVAQTKTQGAVDNVKETVAPKK